MEKLRELEARNRQKERQETENKLRAFLKEDNNKNQLIQRLEIGEVKNAIMIEITKIDNYYSVYKITNLGSDIFSMKEYYKRFRSWFSGVEYVIKSDFENDFNYMLRSRTVDPNNPNNKIINYEEIENRKNLGILDCYGNSLERVFLDINVYEEADFKPIIIENTDLYYLIDCIQSLNELHSMEAENE